MNTVRGRIVIALLALSAAVAPRVAAASDRHSLPPEIRSLALRGARTAAEQALLRAAATRYDVPNLETNGKCGFTAVSSAAQYLAQYTPSQRTFLSTLAARQAMHRSVLSPSGHIRVHYDTSGFNAIDMADTNANGVPDYVDLMCAVFDSVWYLETNMLGYPAPPSDGGRGGGDEFDVYVVEMNLLQYYGYTDRDLDNELPGSGPTHRYSSSIAIDNDFAESYYSTHGSDAVRVTAAHEFFHAIQMGAYGMWDMTYANSCDESGGIPNRWFYEMSSVWMETVVYPGIHDYLHSSVTPLFTGCPSTSFRGMEDVQLGITPCCDLGYSLVLFFRYLVRKEGDDITLVRRVWENERTQEPLRAIGSAVRFNAGYTLSDAWCDFTQSLVHAGRRSVDTSGLFILPESDSLPTMRLRTTMPVVPTFFGDSLHAMSAAYYGAPRTAGKRDTVFFVITNHDTLRGAARDTARKGFRLTVSPDLSYTFAPDQNNWCVLLARYLDTVDFAGTTPPFPDPFIADGTTEIFFPTPGISLTSNVELRVFTESGTLAYARSGKPGTVRHGKYGVAWNGRRADNELVNSGVYIYVIGIPRAGEVLTSDNSVIGKIAVIRK